MKIKLECMGCKREVGLRGGDAVVHVRLADAYAFGEASRKWEAERKQKPFLTRDDLDSIPVAPGWGLHCDDCNPHWNEDRTEACAGCYWYDAVRCNTPAKLLHHTAHMMEKDWFAWTRWGDFIRPYSQDS